MFRVGIQRSVVAALRRLHLAHHPACGLLHYASEQRIAAAQPCVAIQTEQQAVVVQHLLEMRDVPACIHAVAAEAAAELVIQPTQRHLLQGEQRHVACLFIVPRMRLPQQQIEFGRMQELWRIAEAAMHAVEILAELLHCSFEWRGCERDVIRTFFRLPGGEGSDELFALCMQLATFCFVGLGDMQQQFRKAGQTVARLLGEIGAAVERRAVRARNMVNGQPPLRCVSR